MCAKQSLSRPADARSVNVTILNKGVVSNSACNHEEATPHMKPEPESEQAVMRKREGYRAPSYVIECGGLGVMESRRQHCVSIIEVPETSSIGVQVHGMFTRSTQELGRSPKDTGLGWSLRHQSLKRERRVLPYGEVRSVRSSEASGLPPVTGKEVG